MPNRTLHNLVNAMLFGFSGNDIHQYMDRAAKTLRSQHRDVGHDLPSLIQMFFSLTPKYKANDIIKTWLLHKTMDGMFSGVQAAVRKKNQGYGKKDSYLEIINKLKKEIFK